MLSTNRLLYFPTLLLCFFVTQAFAQISPSQFSIQMEAHTLRVVAVAIATLRDQSFLQRFPEFKELATEQELPKVIEVLLAHDRAKQDPDLLPDISRFYGMRCSDLPASQRADCKSAVDRLNDRDGKYMKRAQQEAGYWEANGQQSRKGELIEILEKSADLGDRYWAANTDEFGEKPQKGSEFARERILPKVAEVDRSNLLKTIDVLDFLEKSPAFDFKTITQGYSLYDISIWRGQVSRTQVPIRDLQVQLKRTLLENTGLRARTAVALSKRSLKGQPGTAGDPDNKKGKGIMRGGKLLGPLGVALDANEIAQKTIAEGESLPNAMAATFIPGTNAEAADLASSYNEGTSGYRLLEKLPLHARQQLFVLKERDLRLRERFSEQFPTVVALKCDQSTETGKHQVALDFGARLGILRFEFWIKDGKYPLYEFLNIKDDDPKRKMIQRSVLLREVQKVDDCCRHLFQCPSKVNQLSKILTETNPRNLMKGTENQYSPADKATTAPEDLFLDHSHNQ